MTTKTYDVGELGAYKYVVIFSEYQGGFLLSRHRERSMWESQGGHIEAGETPMDAAKRELWEESGATDYYLAPLCDYQVGSEDGKSRSNGMVFRAVIHKLDVIPQSEMGEVKRFDTLPDKLTYPEITPVLFRFLEEHKTKNPSVPAAEMLLQEAASCNPGPWEQHSRYVAAAAEKIAEHCSELDPEKAYLCGLLHDIGRRFGVTCLAHVYDGYHYLQELGYPELARVALTHSFNCGSMEDYIGKFDITEAQQRELVQYLHEVVFDDYDRLIQLCDAIAMADGIVSLEERMNDVKNRYGCYPQRKWDKNMELKKYFEDKMGKDLYQVVF